MRARRGTAPSSPRCRTHRRRINFVEDGEPREELPPLVVPLVPRRASKRSEQRPGAERRAADAEDEHVVVRLPDPLGEPGDLADLARLINELVEAVLASGPAAADLRL